MVDNRCSSSINIAAVRRSPVSRTSLARKFSANWSCANAPDLARECDLSFDRGESSFEIPCLCRDDARKPISRQPAQAVDVVNSELEFANCGQRPRQHRRGCLVALGHQHGERIEQQIGRPRALVTGRGSPRRLSGRADQPSAVGIARPDGGNKGLEMRVACELHIEAFQALAALTSSSTASVPRRWSNAMLPRSCSAIASRSSDGGSVLTAANSESADSSDARITFRPGCCQGPVGSPSSVGSERARPVRGRRRRPRDRHGPSPVVAACSSSMAMLSS